MWYLYLLECINGHYYIGITTNVERRYNEHLSGKGAKYTRANKPLRIISYHPYPSRSEATIAESFAKKLARSQKLAFFTRQQPTEKTKNHL